MKRGRKRRNSKILKAKLFNDLFRHFFLWRWVCIKLCMRPNFAFLFLFLFHFNLSRCPINGAVCHSEHWTSCLCSGHQSYLVECSRTNLEKKSTTLAVRDYVRCIYEMRSWHLLARNFSETFSIGILKILI